MTICPESRKTNCEKHVWILQQVQASAKLGMSGKIPRGEALLRRMSGASPTRCLTSPATSTPSATHNFLYKTSKTAPKGAVFLIFSAIVITVFCCNNDVLLEKLSDIQEPLSQLHVGIILSDMRSVPAFCSASSHSFSIFISAFTFSAYRSVRETMLHLYIHGDNRRLFSEKVCDTMTLPHKVHNM